MSDEFDPFEINEEGQEPEPTVVDVDPTRGIPWGLILVFLGIALIVIFAVQNTESVSVQFLWMDGQFPLAIVILVTAFVSILIGELIVIVYRRRRRKRLAEKEELRQYRDQI